jgi:hypothetical protein
MQWTIPFVPGVFYAGMVTERRQQSFLAYERGDELITRPDDAAWDEFPACHD